MTLATRPRYGNFGVPSYPLNLLARSRLESHQQTCQQRRALFEGSDNHMLSWSVRASAHRAKTVEGRNAERSSEISVRSAACGAFLERHSHRAGELLRVAEEDTNARRTL
jgi:hypothetical protein